MCYFINFIFQFVGQKEFLNNVAVEALIEDMPEFITLLIDNGLDLDQFVTYERLKKLYRKVRFLLTLFAIIIIIISIIN